MDNDNSELIGHGYYITIPMSVVQDKRLKDSCKLLFGIIANLCNQRGYCFASNAYIAKACDMHEITVSKNIQLLIEFDYLILFHEVDKNGMHRRLKLSETAKGGLADCIVGDKSSDLGGVSRTTKHKNKVLKTEIKNKDYIIQDLQNPFDDQLSNNAWSKWVEYRKEIRKALTAKTIRLQIQKLKKAAPHTRAAMIERSIENGWTGLFEINQKQNKVLGQEWSDSDILK